MMKHISDFKVIENVQLNDRVFLLRLTPKDGAPIADTVPGQFVEVRIDREPSVFLRRPISIHFVDVESNEIWLLIQKVGNATFQLSSLTKNDVVNLIYPLGNGFTMPQLPAERKLHYLLIGGGVGIAPLLELGAALKRQNVDVTFLLGGRSITDIVQIAEFEKYGRVCITTEDGTKCEGIDCEPGYVTTHSLLSKETFDAIRVCGPKPMMMAVAKYANSLHREESHYCEVSLENKMACGLGVCLCCVEDTKSGHKCVCSEGPVFDINDLKW